MRSHVKASTIASSGRADSDSPFGFGAVTWGGYEICERRQMTVYIIVVVLVIIVGSLWLWGPAKVFGKVFGTLFFWWLDSDDN